MQSLRFIRQSLKLLVLLCLFFVFHLNQPSSMFFTFQSSGDGVGEIFDQFVDVIAKAAPGARRECNGQWSSEIVEIIDIAPV